MNSIPKSKMSAYYAKIPNKNMKIEESGKIGCIILIMNIMSSNSLIILSISKLKKKLIVKKLKDLLEIYSKIKILMD